MDFLSVEHTDGSYQLKHGDTLYPITQLVGSLGLGWRASFGIAAEGLPTVLALRHDDSRQAVWYLDQRQRLIANAAADLPAAQRSALEQLARREIAQIGAALVLGLADAYAPTDAAAGFATAIAHDRGLLDELLPEMCPRGGSVVLENIAGLRHPDAEQAVARACGRSVSGEALSSFFRQALLAVQVQAVQDGHLTMPSPLDGTLLKSHAAWCLEPTDERQRRVIWEGTVRGDFAGTHDVFELHLRNAILGSMRGETSILVHAERRTVLGFMPARSAIHAERLAPINS